MKSIRLGHLNHRGSQQIKIVFDFDPELIALVKQVKGITWSLSEQCWYVTDTPENLDSVYRIFYGKARIDDSGYFNKGYGNGKAGEGARIGMTGKRNGKGRKQSINWRVQKLKEIPEEYKNLLERRRYSSNTIKVYVSLFKSFINYFPDREVEELGENEVRLYQDYLVKSRKVSSSTQNQAINAIKFYFEKVMGGPRKYYCIERPRKEKKLPQVFSEEQLCRLFNAISNLKHRIILILIYSAGFRIGELIGLRIQDILEEKGLIFIRKGKGKKDRVTIFAEKIMPLVRQYRKEYQPRYWLFEGPKGKQYSTSSVRTIYKKALERADLSGDFRLHDLRHSFATHLIEDKTHIRYVQELLGHESLKTTQIYTHVTKKNLAEIRSPFDKLDL
jgi:integrase/recombinase XerD